MKADLKKVKKYATDQIKSGRPKEDVFNEIYTGCNDFRLFEQIATIIQYIPDPVRIEKYVVYNALFLLLMIAIDVTLIITSDFEALILFLLLTALVAGMKTKYYQWITFVGGVAFISIPIILFLDNPDSQETNRTIGLVSMGISGLLILLSVTIPKYLTPDYKVIEDIKIDDDGKEIKIKRISFN